LPNIGKYCIINQTVRKENEQVNSYKFIVNPIAGGGRAKALMPKIEKRFKESGAEFDLYMTRGPEDAIGAAADAAREGFGVVVAVGGDGTVNEVLNGIAGTEAVLAAVHGGKGNDFATAAEMPRDSDAAADALLKAKIRPIDLGRVLNRYFINSVGVGFDAAVALRVNQGVEPFKGVSAYIYAFLKTLSSYQPVDMEIDIGNGPVHGKPLLVAVGIGQAYGGGMKIVPDAIQDDGLFDVCIMENMKRSSLIYHFPKVFSGKLKNLEEAGMYRTSEVRLKLSEPRPLHLEGEILFGDCMHFTLEPKAMKILTGQMPIQE
jgi:diacylglycerol kinase (ATP)